MAKDILIVDDEADICLLLQSILEEEGYAPRTASTDAEAFEAVRQKRPDMVILDIWLEGSNNDGLQILERLKREHPDLPMLMISGHGTIEAAVTAMRRGAAGFIEKPFRTHALLDNVEKTLREKDLKRELEELKTQGAQETQLTGESNAIQSVINNIKKIAPTNSRVMIEGASGSGKGVAARMVHDFSARCNAPFVTLNCATVRANQIETELFGVEPNKNNANETRKVGVLEKAHGGTLYLDEIADMPLSVQAKLLRVLQDQSFKRIGGSSSIAIDVRVVSSTNQNVIQLITDKKFREDLYYRLNVGTLKMPSLSQRREDIPFLAQYFMKKIAETAGVATRLLSPEVITALQAYQWPGNVRQLRNVIEWLLIMSPGAAYESIKVEALPPEIRGEATPMMPLMENHSEALELPLREAREMFERSYLLTQVRRFGGNISRTAEFIGMERSALHRKLRSLNVDYNAKVPMAGAANDAGPAVEDVDIDQSSLTDRGVGSSDVANG